MAPPIDIRTLLVVITLVLFGRGLVLAYLWYVERNYLPVREWTLGSILVALGSFMMGLRNIAPELVSVVLAQGLLIPGWLLIDSGIVRAAERQPPWRIAIAVCCAALAGAVWFTLGSPDYAARTLLFTLAVILFDGYALFACLRFRGGRRTLTLRIVAVFLGLLILSNLWKTGTVVQFGASSLFDPNAAMAPFLIFTIIYCIVTTALFVLLAAQKLQEELDVEIAERKRAEQEIIRNREILQRQNRLLLNYSGELQSANQRLAELSVTDSLTGLPNRRRFDEALASEWLRALRGGQPLAVLMIDVDRFKDYNDHYGHQAGDACLAAIAEVLREQVKRAGDMAARYGGEEFVVIASNSPEDKAIQLAAMLVEAVAALDVPHDFSPHGKVTISVGVAVQVPVNEDKAEQLMARADQALYRAKEAGRNRVAEG